MTFRDIILQNKLFVFRGGVFVADNKKLIYLNTPITTKENDIIGLSVCADKLSDAIDEGAQMIAITSPFGSGKTSVIDLLQEKRAGNKNEHILKIPMWSQLHQLENQANELHKNFLYQISSLINHKRGTYISRRLSNNYGLLTLHANKNRSWLFFTFAILLACASWCVNHFSENFEILFPIFENKSSYVTIALAISAIYIGVIILARAEIIFSSQKSEKNRTIEEDEIIDLYRTEILKYGTRLGNWIRSKTKDSKCKLLRGHKYIIVVEDLDRTNDGKSVIEFLTELRKYYLPTNYSKSKTGIFKNKVVFIVTIKPESVLISEITSKKIKSDQEIDESKELQNLSTIDKANEMIVNGDYISETYTSEHLFAKIFDYVLDLQTINIADYETILEGLLSTKQDVLSKMELKSAGKLIEIPGMLWIIRGKTLDIREIKNRLNKAFLIFETLQNRFSEEKDTISFEKCAIVAYLTTAFEREFKLTDDTAFQKLIEMDMQHELDEVSCKEILNAKNNDYVKAVLELTKSKLIDDSYRMYFYNYPKDSKIYSYSETIVRKAILYGEDSEDLDNAIENVLKNCSTIIVDSFKQMHQLKLRFPHIVFQKEELYIQALSHATNEVVLWLDGFDTNASSADKNNSEIIRILSYDSNRTIYNEELAQKYCASWERTFNEDTLLNLRKCLCEKFPNEVLWYKQLFFGVHNIISNSEMQFLSIVDCINLMNIQNDKFGLDEVNYIIERFCVTDNVSNLDVDKVKAFLVNAKSKIDLAEASKIYLRFMRKLNDIIPEFESTVVEFLNMESDNEDEDEYLISAEEQEHIFIEYQELINQVAYKQLTNQTLENISEIQKFNGYERYSDNVSSILYSNEFYVDFILINLLKGNPIDLMDTNIYSAIKENIDWFYQDLKVFEKLRIFIIKNATDLIAEFNFMFVKEFTAISESEFDLIKNRTDINEENILKLIPVQLVTESEAEFISNYFCRKNQNNNVAFAFLKYIAKMDIEVSKDCFESLDYTYAIQYYRFSATKKSFIKELFSEILELDTCKGKLKFMKITQCLDSGFESAIAEDLINDQELQEYYVDVINDNAKSVTAITLKNLYSFNTYYAMNDIVTERYYKDKKYSRYIVSKTLFHKKFDIDSDEKFDVLWPVYVDIYGENKFSNTCSYMSNNHEFLKLIMKRRAYEGLSEEARINLAKVNQDSDCIKNILEYSTIFAINYFSSIAGFEDYDAAHTFITIIENNAQLLASNEIYNNTYSKLVNGPLKARYTIARKRNGFKQ